MPRPSPSRKANIIAGIHIVENAYEQVHTIRVTPPEQIIATDAELLKLANTLLPRVPFNQLDVLIVDTMGKNISGTGMDPNIIGMWRRFGGPKVPDFTRIVILSLTPETHGNAMGIGFADFTTRRVFDQIDHHALMMNAITAEAIAAAKIPIIRANDEDAIAWAIRSALRGVERAPRIARIHSTLHLDTLAVSPALLDEVRANDNLELVGELEPLRADESGHLVGYGWKRRTTALLRRRRGDHAGKSRQARAQRGTAIGRDMAQLRCAARDRGDDDGRLRLADD